MALFTFNIAVYGFDQWSAAANTNNTVSYTNGTTFSLNANATETVFEVQDDDGVPTGGAGNEFSDGYIDTPGDGGTPSTANNDQVLTQNVFINGTEFFAGDQVELEFAFTTTSGETFWIIRIAGQNVGISGPTLPEPGTTYTVGGSADGSETPIETIPCFTDGAMVLTDKGPRAIETLTKGDRVVTLDNGLQTIRWTGNRPVTPLEMRFFPNLQPVVIRKDAFGPGRPNADLVLSDQHRVLMRLDPAAALYFDDREVITTAKSLINGKTVQRMAPRQPLTYRHILLQHHELMFVNGLETESLYPASRHLPEDQRLMADLDGQFADVPFIRPSLRLFEAALAGHQVRL